MKWFGWIEKVNKKKCNITTVLYPSKRRRALRPFFTPPSIALHGIVLRMSRYSTSRTFIIPQPSISITTRKTLRSVPPYPLSLLTRTSIDLHKILLKLFKSPGSRLLFRNILIGFRQVRFIGENISVRLQFRRLRAFCGELEIFLFLSPKGQFHDSRWIKMEKMVDN